MKLSDKNQQFKLVCWYLDGCSKSPLLTFQTSFAQCVFPKAEIKSREKTAVDFQHLILNR